MVTEVIAFSLLVIAILYFYYMDFRHRLNRLTARRDLVRAAERLGLKRKDSAEPGALGTFEGRVDGYFVRVTADQHTKISIKLKSKRDVWLFRTNRLEKWISRGAEFEPFPEAVSFSFRSRALNGFFHHRFASRSVAEALRHAGPSLRLFDELVKKWRWTMGTMYLSGEQISASPSRGGGHKCHSITGRQLKAFLPDLIVLAQMWDSLPELLEER